MAKVVRRVCCTDEGKWVRNIGCVPWATLWGSSSGTHRVSATLHLSMHVLCLCVFHARWCMSCHKVQHLHSLQWGAHVHCMKGCLVGTCTLYCWLTVTTLLSITATTCSSLSPSSSSICATSASIFCYIYKCIYLYGGGHLLISFLV